MQEEAMKVSSKQLAMIAGHYLNITCQDLAALLLMGGVKTIHEDMRALAASVLSQTEPKPAAKRKTAKVKK